MILQKKEIIQQLTDIYDWCITKGKSNGGYAPEEWQHMNLEEQKKIYSLYKHMLTLQFIDCQFEPQSKRPFLISLEQRGIDYLQEETSPKPAATPTINIHSMQGTNFISSQIDQLTINYSATFDEVRKSILSSVDDIDKKRLLEAITTLEDTIKKGAPLPKGILASMNDYLQGHSCIISPLISVILQYLKAKF